MSLFLRGFIMLLPIFALLLTTSTTTFTSCPNTSIKINDRFTYKTVDEIDILLYAIQEQAQEATQKVFDKIKKEYYKPNASPASLILKKCTIAEIKELGISDLTKCALSQRFCAIVNDFKTIFSSPVHHWKKLNTVLADPEFDINHPTESGIIPLHYYPYITFTHGYHPRNGKVTSVDNHGNTVLHAFSRKGNICLLFENMRYKKSLEAIINNKNNTGETALFIVTQRHIAKKKLAYDDLLWPIGPKKDKKTESHLDGIQLLLELGADPEIVNSKGICFTQLATQYAELGTLLHNAEKKALNSVLCS